ncbi:hypothetical protein SAMN05421756_105284 [Microlunatus flavus]|uniref:Phage integrase family protein n=2 Tax=Microlunatus flavus TaxID=1036181 RepID=A0A1H9IK49_9ACTN|nr:hypothetical protein SAMN05421756_105284 [Microlunatus flavus]
MSKARELDRRQTASTEAGKNASTGHELLQHFLDPARPHPTRGGRHKPWARNTIKGYERIAACYLGPLLSASLSDWSKDLAKRCYAKCPTNNEVIKTRRLLSSMITTGVRDDFLRAEQKGIYDVTVPLIASARPQRSNPVAQHGESAELITPDEVPTNEAVHRLARALYALPARRLRRLRPDIAALWELLANLAAYAGLRESELFALAAPDVLAAAGGLPTVRVRWQMQDGKLERPKGGKQRLAVVTRLTPSGYPLYDALINRADEALQEQRDGTNPNALMFPAPRGGYWNASNFLDRRFDVAAEIAGWTALEWSTPKMERRVSGARKAELDGDGKVVMVVRRDWKHTFHSLRHRYASTAIDEWNWTPGELLANGGWMDDAFVRNRYYGASNVVHATAAEKQRRGLSAGGARAAA